MKAVSILVAGMIATSVAFAADAKKDAPKKDAPKAEVKKDEKKK